jgi:hypothetical protein
VSFPVHLEWSETDNACRGEFGLADGAGGHRREDVRRHEYAKALAEVVQSRVASPTARN